MQPSEEERNTCIICLDQALRIQPCGHTVTCSACAELVMKARHPLCPLRCDGVKIRSEWRLMALLCFPSTANNFVHHIHCSISWICHADTSGNACVKESLASGMRGRSCQHYVAATARFWAQLSNFFQKSWQHRKHSIYSYVHETKQAEAQIDAR